jgi:hypothetical protein
MPDIVICPHCAMRIIPNAAGACPSCGKGIAEPVAPPPAPPRPRSRHPILFLLFVGVIATGFWRYAHRQVDDLQSIAIDLALIWGGCLAIVFVNIVRKKPK